MLFLWGETEWLSVSTVHECCATTSIPHPPPAAAPTPQLAVAKTRVEYPNSSEAKCCVVKLLGGTEC